MATPRAIRRPHVATPLLLFLFLLLSIPKLLAAPSHLEGFDSYDHTAEADLTTDDDDEDLEFTSFASPSLPISTSTSSSPPPPSPTSSPNPNPTSTPTPNPNPILDLWDEDEFEGIPFPSDPTPPESDPTTTTSTSLDPQSDPSSSSPLPVETKSSPVSLVSAYSVEIVCVSFLICFLLNYFTGKRRNESIALAWAAKFATRDSIFDKNFSLLGTGDGKDTPLLLKEGLDVFKFYASGRRFCQGMLATMELKARHDLISLAVELVFPKKDTITFEVMMNEDAMDHVVLAVARKKAAKVMQKEERDLQRFAAVVSAPPTGRRWVAEELAVVAESKEVAGDLINEAVLDQVKNVT